LSPFRIFAVVLLVTLAIIALTLTEQSCPAYPFCAVDPSAVPFVLAFVALAFVVAALGRLGGRPYLAREDPPTD